MLWSMTGSAIPPVTPIASPIPITNTFNGPEPVFGRSGKKFETGLKWPQKLSRGPAKLKISILTANAGLCVPTPATLGCHAEHVVGKPQLGANDHPAEPRNQ